MLYRIARNLEMARAVAEGMSHFGQDEMHGTCRCTDAKRNFLEAVSDMLQLLQKLGFCIGNTT